MPIAAGRGYRRPLLGGGGLSQAASSARAQYVVCARALLDSVPEVLIRVGDGPQYQATAFEGLIESWRKIAEADRNEEAKRRKETAKMSILLELSSPLPEGEHDHIGLVQGKSDQEDGRG